MTRLPYVAALIAVSSATALTNLITDRGRWRIGFFVAPRFAVREAFLGALFGAVLVGVADLLIIASTALHHVRSAGFPWSELAIVYVPAALHEELLFRGYLFQKVRAWRRRFAIGVGAILFGSLHTIDRPVALVNLIIAGVLLALAYELFERLWFPIGLHLAWNLASGPILGYGVSGFLSETSLFAIAGNGRAWLTGGDFGLEGSIWAGMVELAGVFLLLWLRKPRPV